MAYPGGRIFVDGKLAGQDSTSTLTLEPGSYNVRVENRFVGDTTQKVVVEAGQVGVVLLVW
ncbi:MAG: PEGA domain-containing protein [Minicystis sp.]